MATTTTTTVRDLASHANVSVGTVSRVLNRKPGIKPESEARVLRAVKDLGYRLPKNRPLGGRRYVSSKQTGNIGLVMVGHSDEWAQHPLFLAYLRGVSRACEQAGEGGIAGGYHPITEFGSKHERVLRLVSDRKVDGLVIKGDLTQCDWFEGLPEDLPVVALNSQLPALPIDQVMCDDHWAGYYVTQKLWEMGHRRIAFATIDGKHPMLILRQQGCEAFMRMRGVDCLGLSYITNETPSGSDPMYLLPDMREAVNGWWSRPAEQRPTAIVAANDWTAAGLYKVLKDYGVSIGQEVSVVGFDNDVRICESLSPSLSSYAIPVEQAALVAASLLIEKIEGGARSIQPQVRMVRGQMVERQSVSSWVTA